MNKTFSAVITTYNRAHIIEETINSVLNQTQAVDELIIVDDGSTDDTRNVVNNLAQQSNLIKYVGQENKGVSAARNRGILESSSEFIVFLDDDDLWPNTHITMLKNNIELFPTAIIYAGFNARDTSPDKPILPQDNTLLAEYQNCGADGDYLVHKQQPLTKPFYTPHFSTCAVRSSFAKKSLLDESLKAREDIEFFWRLSEQGDILLDKRSHALTRQFETSLFSLPDTASEKDKLDLDYNRSYWGAEMLKKLLADRSKDSCPVLYKQYGNALLGCAHYSFLIGNTTEAIKLLIKSFEHIKTVNQIKLLARIIFRIR